MMPPMVMNVEEEGEEEEEEDRPHDYDEGKNKKVGKLIDEEPTDLDYHARRVVRKACSNKKRLNLMNDSVLHEVIAKGKTSLAIAIVDLPDDLNRSILHHENYYGDTPLHRAAEIGDITVANALLRRDRSLAQKMNKKGETPLHKAVQFGNLDVFNFIIKKGGSDMAFDRTGDGSTILHYAIMHDQTKEALVIAKSFAKLIPTRNADGASPLQIMAAFYKKPTKIGTFIYKYLTLDKDASMKEVTTDEESGITDGLKPRNRGSWWSRLPGINNLRRRMVKEREEMSQYEELLKLLVRKEDFDFYIKGYDPPERQQSFLREEPAEDDFSSINAADLKLYEAVRELAKSAGRPSEEVSEASDRRIWEESPLITGVKLGLDDFVIKILQLMPRSATYVGLDGMNVLQAAVKYGRKQVVKAIHENKLLPQWLFTDLESDTKNTILHMAASNKNFDKKAEPLGLQDELIWFQMLAKIVPKMLLNCRNKGQKTAQELFDEKHEETLMDCRKELADIGRTCSPLVAAVVFSSSFYIPSEDSRATNELAFKIFSHVYVFGFSWAASALIMYLLLVVTPYKQGDFRRAVPWHYMTANILLTMSLAAFSVAFACNMYLQIYGKKTNSYADLATLLLELLVVPLACGLAYFFSGAFWRNCSALKRLIK